MRGRQDLFLHPDFDFLLVQQILEPRVVQGLELLLATRKLLDLGGLLGNEGLDGLMLPPEFDDILLKLVPRADGLDAPVKEFDRGFRLVALAQFQDTEKFL